MPPYLLDDIHELVHVQGRGAVFHHHTNAGIEVASLSVQEGGFLPVAAVGTGAKQSGHIDAVVVELDVFHELLRAVAAEKRNGRVRARLEGQQAGVKTYL